MKAFTFLTKINQQNIYLFSFIIFSLISFANLSISLGSEAIEFGYRDFSYPNDIGGNDEPTGEKPESKLWWHDGFWWGILWSSPSNSYTIHQYYISDKNWNDTGIEIDNRTDTRCDVLSDGNKLYIVSHIFAKNAGAPSQIGNRGELYRLSYITSTKSYSLDEPFPVEITGGVSETLVLDKDSTGQLWVTYVEI